MKKTDKLIKLSATDLVGHLNCGYITKCDIQVANGDIKKPEVWNPFLETLWERGDIHEKGFVDHLKNKGLNVIKIEEDGITKESVEQTIQAMKSGIDVIVQGAFSDEQWHGKSDILIRVEMASSLGAWSYEPIDTKLARETKGGTVLQLCLYSELLSQIQGIWPEYMYVVVPWSEYKPIPYRVMEFAAYFRYVKSKLENTLKSREQIEVYPDPKPFCDVCRWSENCERKRKEDDHLSLVANISKSQIKELNERKIETMADLASLPLPIDWKPSRGAVTSYTRIREQARIQVEGRDSGENKFEILSVEEGFGFHCLPEPSAGDVFFDIEGDPFVGESGMEFLFGYQYGNEKGEIAKVSDWAFSFSEEKRVFESFVDFIMEHWSRYPDMHIYHYNHYEPTALKRLMGKYAAREEDVDQMLRAGLFVDLYQVVKHSIRASVESYSIKKLEPFYGYTRNISLQKANMALFNFQARIELNDFEAISDENKEIIQGYNQDDCASTFQLRGWLEELRTQCIDEGIHIGRPGPEEGAPSENITEWLERINRIIEVLAKDLPLDPNERDDEQQALWILANILDWHRRENKSMWWEYFRMRELTSEDLLDERKGLAELTYIECTGGTPKAPVHKYSFRPQETDIRSGKTVVKQGGNNLGTIESISFEECTVEIKKRGDSKDIHPEAIFVHENIPSAVLAESLVRVGEWVAKNGLVGEGEYQAARDLLLKVGPTIETDKIRNEDESALESAIRVILKLEKGVFPIQGPPGTGKTHTGAHMICALVEHGKKVGITANSHKVIRNLIDKTIEVAQKKKLNLQCIQKGKELEEDNDYLVFAKKNDEVFNGLRSGYNVAGGTAWLWSRPEAAESVDVLFVDEAAQMSLANVLAVSQAGKTVVLLGDPQQLDQPTQGSHPDGTDVSALNHVLDGAHTIPENKGLFLEETWRLHPEIASFTSELFYDGKLKSRKGLENQRIESSDVINGAGLIYIPVKHSGNQSSSKEEAAVIKKMVENILASNTQWSDSEGKKESITLSEILIIAPYNAQVFEIQQQLPDARVGTVDKFQGQEAPITIYSMATSTYEDAPRGMDFLYNLNRLNVATSRARCISILVACPQVFEPDCKTPDQIRLANAFCRFLERADVIEIPA
ncbi:MAG: TM0106 family RecB-like putative nuclease [Candidatus Omnitrophica bacterium]|nr:TM0106 family RecB-like putative nuclease [Candidatus Omnitrophota bacterium]